MPNKRSAEKALRQTKWRTEKNKRIKKHTNALTHEIRTALKDKNNGNSKELFKKLQQTLAKTAKTHAIHKNTAKRKTAQLQKLIN